MANWNEQHKKILDPFNSANICFGRFIGRNYVWKSDESTNNVFSMVPVLPQDHPIDKNWICSDLPAPYQHPLNPSPQASSSVKTFKQWSTPGTILASYKHASNISGYIGTLKYHLAAEFGGPGNEGKILGTNGLVLPGGASVTISPGRANTFASPTKGYKEMCVQYVTELQTSGDCYDVMSSLGGDISVGCWAFPGSSCHPPIVEFYSPTSYCSSYYQGPEDPARNKCPLLIKNPAGEITNQDWTQCIFAGYPCAILPTSDPDYLFNCSYFFPGTDIYINPNCMSDGQGGHITKQQFSEGDDQEYLNNYIKCTPRYICGSTTAEIPEYNMSPQNKCPTWNSRLQCDGFTCNEPQCKGDTGKCNPGSGAICPGNPNKLGNFCAYSSVSPEGESDPSPTISEWRSNGFLEFPPVHVTWNNTPSPEGFDFCSGKFKAESCCIWTENDLGEFAVSGKNWLLTEEIEQGGQCGQGALGIGNIALQVSVLLNREIDNDCNPMCVGRDKRSLVTLPDIRYEGVCVVSGCFENCEGENWPSGQTCAGLTCSIKTKEDCDLWQPEGFKVNTTESPQWTYIYNNGPDPITCQMVEDSSLGSGIYAPCPEKCWTVMCNSVETKSNVPQKPRLAETIRGKMICLENMIRDPEYSKEAWFDNSCKAHEKGWCVPNEIYENGDAEGITSCEAFKDYYNNKYLGPSADYPCRWVNDSAATKGAYEFIGCRNSFPGETHYPDNYGNGPSIGLYGLVVCDDCAQKAPGMCCTCMRSYTPNIGGYNPIGQEFDFKSACQAMNGLYRDNTRCPHGNNQKTLKNHYKEDLLNIEGYRTHCVGYVTELGLGNKFGPMTCSPGIDEEGNVDGNCGARKPDWYCPDPLMTDSSELISPRWFVDPDWNGCDDAAPKGQLLFTPPFNGSVTNIASGNNFSVALIDNSGDTPKNIIVWGRNPIESLYNPPDIEAESVSVAYSHILAIEKESNRVFAWGSNLNGECDIPGITLKAKQVIASSGYFIDSGFSIALGMTGQIVIWGTNGFSDTGPNAEYSINKLPSELPPENNCSAVFSGARCAYAICGSENKLYGWGWGVVENAIEGVEGIEGTTNVNTLACISTSESNIQDTHLFLVKGTTTTYYENNGVSHDIIVNRVEYFAGQIMYDDYNPPIDLTVSGSMPKISISQISAGYYHVSVLANNGLTLGITQDVYVWTLSNNHGVKDILLANTGTGCIQNPITGCGIANNYSHISSGKWHMTGINNNSGADNLPFVSIWGDKNGGFDTIYPVAKSQFCPFAGYMLDSGITLDETGCGICEEGNINPIYIRYNQWATPANPFDPVGYLGLHTKITWLNTCSHININGAKEESKTDHNYFDFILNKDNTITPLPGTKHRASGVDGHCRSHIGTFTNYRQQQQGALSCFEPGSAWGTPKENIPLAHTRETTYSGPCWPCPQLYDSLGSPEFLYGATHGPEPVKIDNSLYYKFNIKLNNSLPWTPSIWGKMSCHDINNVTYLINHNQTSGQLAEDFETSLLLNPNPCCSSSKPGYYDQVLIVDSELKQIACPDIPTSGSGSELQCWRCPGWQIRYNENQANSVAWDGIHTSELGTDGITYSTGSERYYKAAQNFAGQTVSWDLPLASVMLPWVGVCTIMHPVEDSELQNPSFIGITSELFLPNGVTNPAAGRTMCWCQSPENRADVPNAVAGPQVLTLPLDSGGPGCVGCEKSVCLAIPYCCDIQWDKECAAMANVKCNGCSSRISPQECQNYHALEWCADKYNPSGWTGGKTIGLDLFDCNMEEPYQALKPNNKECLSCLKCDLPLCRHKYNCNLKCPCGTYGLDCAKTCSDITGSYGPYDPGECNNTFPIALL